MFYLTKTFTFEAAHCLPGHDGKCARLHGHSWRGQVVVAGPTLHDAGPKAGMLIDYQDVDQAVRPLVEKYLDHHHLNDSLCMHSPTSERIAAWLYNQLSPRLPGLAAVVIEETCTCRCEYRP